MTYAESVKGCCKGVKNVVFVNIGWGLGIGIICNGKLYYGKSGYSGEFTIWQYTTTTSSATAARWDA